MSSLLATPLPPSRIYHKQEEDVHVTAPVENLAAESYYANPPPPAPCPAADVTAVESTVTQAPTPEIYQSKCDVLLEDTPAVPPALEDTIACPDLEVPPAVEFTNVTDNVETYVPLLPLPEQIKKMSFISPFKPKIPHYKSYKKLFMGPPPPQTTADDLPRGMYVPSAASPYPSLDYDMEPAPAVSPPEPEATSEVYPNPFKTSCSVLRLSGGLFEEFLKQMDVVLVMFYKGALGQQGSMETWSKDQFVQASEKTKRTNHAYAAVDCGKENSICKREEVTSFPLFRLYSKGHTVDTIKNYQSFDSEAMQKFVEYSPVLEQRPRTDSLFTNFASSSPDTQSLS